MRVVALISLFSLTSFDDIQTKQVKVLEIIGFALIGLVLNILKPENSIESTFLGILVGVILYLFSHLSKEKIGKGDALIIMVAGLFLGGMNTIILLWISSLLSLIGGLILIKKLKADKNLEIPFVPFITLGYLIMLGLHGLGSVIG